MQSEQSEIRSVSLKPGQELRIEVDFKEIVRVKLTSGLAEMFGTELASGAEYLLKGRKTCIFTWHGCTLELQGTTQSEYVAEETPMHVYLNTHMALNQMREQSASSNGTTNHIARGPRVLVVGPADVGKTSLCKILVNYAVKMGSKPLFVDIDTTEASVAVPGCLTATTMKTVIDIEEDLGSTPLTTNTTHLTYYFGYSSPIEKHKLYSSLVHNLATVVQQKMDINQDARSSGMIINAPSDFVQGSSGYEILKDVISSLKVNVVIVLSHERLYSDLKRTYQNESIEIVKLPKSGGVVNRDTAFRRQEQMFKVKSYFYGTPDTALGRSDLNPYSIIVPFSELHIRRVGDLNVPSSALPLGTESRLEETRVVNVEPGVILLNSILAVSSVDVSDDADDKTILESNVLGFIYISAVDEAKEKVTVLSPTPGRLPKKFLIMGALKWVET